MVQQKANLLLERSLPHPFVAIIAGDMKDGVKYRGWEYNSVQR
jgi:hypothetical protein